MDKPQSFENHRSLPPPLMLVAAGLLAAHAVWCAWLAVEHRLAGSVWAALVAFALVAALYSSRRSTQIVQDRVIRLEMRLRLERLLGTARRAEIDALETRQLVALRFASDAELPALFDEVRSGRLTTPRDIKRAVREWQADWLRA